MNERGRRRFLGDGSSPAAGALLLLIAPWIAGCPGLEKLDDDGTGGIPPRVQQALDESCGDPGCHGSAGPAAGLVLTAPDSEQILTAEVEGYPLVAIGDVEGSYLAIKILGLAGLSGEQMPAREPIPADAVNLSLIVGWIAGVDVDGDADPVVDCIVPETIPDEIDYAEHVWPIFAAKCGGGACHGEGGETDLALVDANSDAELIDVPSSIDLPQVAPGDPDGSYLWHRLLGTGELVGGSAVRMPAGESLCGEELSLIYAWISGL